MSISPVPEDPGQEFYRFVLDCIRLVICGKREITQLVQCYTLALFVQPTPKCLYDSGLLGVGPPVSDRNL
jgi:hypothetical protein